MAGKEYQTLVKMYQSDQGETEDEEVKRNCIMGESGMRDSDFFDSDSEMEEVEDEVHINDEKKVKSDGELREDQIIDLVKFVSVGSQVLKPKGVVLYCPTPVVPSLASHTGKSDENEATSNKLNVKSQSTSTIMNVRSGFSPRSKEDNDIEISVSSSSSSSGSGRDSDSDSESNNGDIDSVESETDAKATSFDFPFDGGEELSMEAGVGNINVASGTEDSSCKSSLDDQEETQESISVDYSLVGASGASVDDKWLMAKQKRVLSSNTLSALNQESGRDADLQKKMRLSQQSPKDVCAIPEITLGIEALDQIIRPLPRQYLVRDDFLLIPSCSDDEDGKVLSEELEEKFRYNCVGCSGANLPIPLLTPPQSPRTVDDTIEGQAMNSIEWPSNLVMDSAIITSFGSVSPVSTTSKRGYEQLENNDPSSILGIDEPSAPRIRTISVGTS